MEDSKMQSVSLQSRTGAMKRKKNFHVTLLGDFGVGKTSIFTRFATDRFAPAFLKGDQFKREFTIGDETLFLTMHDTGGMEAHRSLTSSYYHRCECILLVYDVKEYLTLIALSTWIKEARYYTNSVPVFVVGNKCEDGTCGNKSLMKDFCRNNGVQDSFLISAKTGKNFHEMMQSIAEFLYSQFLQTSSSREEHETSTINLGDSDSDTTGGQTKTSLWSRFKSC